MKNKVIKYIITLFGLSAIILCINYSFAENTQGDMMVKQTVQDDQNIIKSKFIILYAQWLKYIEKPNIAVSSRSDDYINCEPYRGIVNLGKPVLPFLIEKITDGKNNSWNESQFFLWYAVREISGVDLIKRSEIMSEQEKAERYINWWNEKQ